LDPLQPITLMRRGMSHISDGELETGLRHLRLVDEGGLAFVGLGLDQEAAACGDVDAAAHHFDHAFRALNADFPAETLATFARACAGDPAACALALALIDAQLARDPKLVPGMVVYVLLSVRETECGLVLLARGATSNDALVLGSLWRGVWPDVLTLPRPVAFTRVSGLATHWDQFGPPDRCRKAANGDYHCE